MTWLCVLVQMVRFAWFFKIETEILKTYFIYTHTYQNMVLIHKKTEKKCVELWSTNPFMLRFLSCLLWFCSVLFNVLTWEDLASFWVYSFSICFSLLLAWKTHGQEHTHTHTHSDLSAWRLCTRPSPGTGPAASRNALLGQPENHRPCLWSNANYSSLKKQKRKKKDLSCQLLGKHRLLWKEKGRRRDRNRSSRSVPAQRCRGRDRKEEEEETRGEGWRGGGEVNLMPFPLVQR